MNAQFSLPGTAMLKSTSKQMLKAKKALEGSEHEACDFDK